MCAITCTCSHLRIYQVRQNSWAGSQYGANLQFRYIFYIKYNNGTALYISCAYIFTVSHFCFLYFEMCKTCRKLFASPFLFFFLNDHLLVSNFDAVRIGDRC